MDELQKKLHELLSNLEAKLLTGKYYPEVVIQTRDKLKLYLKRYLKQNSEYDVLLAAVNIAPTTSSAFTQAANQLKSLIITLIEDIEMSKTDSQMETENDRIKIINDAKKEVDAELKKIQADAREIAKMKLDLEKRTENLLLEEEKLDTFKAKLEIADKSVNFQTDAKNNKMNALIWIAVIVVLIIVLIIIICANINSNKSFSEIAIDIQNNLTKTNFKIDPEVIKTTIYITYSKYIFAKLLLYSLIIYAIKFSVKNYNAQMHNFIVNSHKANSFKSTLSLLDTAKSDDGNDKLLVQATQAIFSHQNTGFYPSDSETNSQNLVTNVIESASKKF